MSMGAMMGRLLPALGCWLCSSSPPLAAAETNRSTLWCQTIGGPRQRISARLRGCRLSPTGQPGIRLGVFAGTAARQWGVLLGGFGGGVRRYGSDAAGGSLHQRHRDVRTAGRGLVRPVQRLGRPGRRVPGRRDGERQEVLEQGLRSAGASPVHIAVRGTASSIRPVRLARHRADASAASPGDPYRLNLAEDEASPPRRTWRMFTAVLDVYAPKYLETAKSILASSARLNFRVELRPAEIHVCRQV